MNKIENKNHNLNSENLAQDKINLETAKIPWRELQRFFAAGKVYRVVNGIDLTEVALRMSQDDSKYVQQLMETEKIFPVADEDAIQWTRDDKSLWSVVVRPFILVQEIFPE